MSSTTESPPAQLPMDHAAAAGMVNVQINGVWHQVPKGTRMIKALEMAGVEVPHYCYHPKLSSPGNCRMCLVEQGLPPRPAPGQAPELDAGGYQPIQWQPRAVISCANTVSENMGIRTDSPLVESVRNGVMEFLLANHPLDCPICDQAGECRLQEFSVGYGRGRSRFAEQKTKKPKNVDIGPRIRLDDERCILCSRCIRFMDEVAGDPVLGFTERGGFTTLTVHPDRRLDSNYGLNTVDICPVGALTSNDFRFQMRVWFLKETPTIDVNCGTGCNITVWTRNNEIYRVTPRENNEVNSAWMPDSHRLAFHAFQNDARLTQPLRRDGGGKHAPAAWSAAVQAAVDGLRRFPAGEVAMVFSARLTNEELFLARRLAETLGLQFGDIVARHGESDGMLISADRNPNTEGVRQIFAATQPGGELWKIREAVREGRIKALLVLHEDLTAEAGFHAADLEKLGFLATVQLLANPTAGAADVVLPGASFAEKRGSMINVTGRLQRLNRAILPPGEARDDWEILRDLIAAAGGSADFDSVPAVFRELAAAVPSLSGLTLGRIGDAGVQVIQTGVTIPLLGRERARVAAGQIVG
jgi:NADH-quinone oxidoreductase subunit G